LENIIFYILIICLILFVMIFLRKWLKRLHHRKKWLQHKRIFDNLYHDINGIELSINDRANLKSDFYGLVYGEVDFENFSAMLAITQPKSTDIFYDLGSGTGKAVFCSALLYDLKKCCGIELLPSLYKTSINQLEKFKFLPDSKASPILFIHGDLLTVDFREATIVFINATSFTAEFWQLISDKLNFLTNGARIIITSKKLNTSSYKLLDAKLYWMSWGWNSVYIYQKIC
jgi:SAM-dependent methyltransferase